LGIVLDVGVVGGGNICVLCCLGWDVIVLEYGEEGVGVVCECGLFMLCGDVIVLFVVDGLFDFVVVFDVLEYLDDDDVVVCEVYRVLCLGGCYFVVVLCDLRLWLVYDEVVGYVCCYICVMFMVLLSCGGFVFGLVCLWNVLLCFVVVVCCWVSIGSDLELFLFLVNFGLCGVIIVECYLFVCLLLGVLLMVEVWCF